MRAQSSLALKGAWKAVQKVAHSVMECKSDGIVKCCFIRLTHLVHSGVQDD